MRPVLGTLDDAEIIARAAREADAVVDTAEAESRRRGGSHHIRAGAAPGNLSCIPARSGIVATVTNGERSDSIYDEYSSFTPTIPRMQQRAAIDQAVFDAAKQGVRSVVIRPTMIYGEGRGSRKESAQVPALIENAKKAGVGLHIGKGENIWANVHIDDVTELYLLALQKAPAGALYYAENGEEVLKM